MIIFAGSTPLHGAGHIDEQVDNSTRTKPWGAQCWGCIDLTNAANDELARLRNDRNPPVITKGGVGFNYGLYVHFRNPARPVVTMTAQSDIELNGEEKISDYEWCFGTMSAQQNAKGNWATVAGAINFAVPLRSKFKYLHVAITALGKDWTLD